MAPWTSHKTTSRRQKAKNGARQATCAVTPAKRSKNPTRVETSLGIRMAEGDSGGWGSGSGAGVLMPSPHGPARPSRRRRRRGRDATRDLLARSRDVARVVEHLGAG